MRLLEIYTDGSFINGNCGYGAVLIENNSVIKEISGRINDESRISHRQVTGEIEAVIKALTWCVENGIKSVTIYYDYQGVSSWATGEWKANKQMTREYSSFFKTCPIDIRWEKVKAHSGNLWNDRADELAKSGAGQSVTENTLKQPAIYSAGFQDFLIKNGFNICNCGIINNMFARLEVGSSNREGIIDIYVKKNGPKIDLRGFKNTAVKELIAELWGKYIHQ